jgi:iron complex transport system ATP-binding protein
MSCPYAIQTRDLAVGYSRRSARCPILQNLNLSVKQGELVCLLGPNGIGKSTLLRTISKLQPALAGSIELDGTDLQHLSPIDIARRMGIVLTDRIDIGALSGRRVVELGRYPHLGWSGSFSTRDHEVVQWAIEAVDAAGIASRDANKLSDGERQRLMIARALAQQPVLLILDEPTAYLDVPSRVELMGLLRRLAREEGLAVIVSTHDLDLALRTADTVWLVTPDRLLHSGSPEDIIAAGLFDAAFRNEKIRFRPEERTFRLVSGFRGQAAVRGDGLLAVLAGAVLEREGFELVDAAAAELEVVISAGGGTPNWKASHHGQNRTGSTFAELADLVRTDWNHEPQAAPD